MWGITIKTKYFQVKRATCSDQKVVKGYTDFSPIVFVGKFQHLNPVGERVANFIWKYVQGLEDFWVFIGAYIQQLWAKVWTIMMLRWWRKGSCVVCWLGLTKLEVSREKKDLVFRILVAYAISLKG